MYSWGKHNYFAYIVVIATRFLTNLFLSRFCKWWSILLSRWFVESQTEILVLTNFTSLVIFSYLAPCLSFWLSFLLLGLYSTGYAKIKYVWGFKLLEMLNYDTIGVLYCSKKKYKVRLVFSLIEIAEVMYCWGFILLKMLK